MAFQFKAGSGGVASQHQLHRRRQERLHTLLKETIDAKADKYLFKNHLGLYECKL